MARKERMGRMGVILLPSVKLKLRSPRGVIFEEEIHTFLMATFTGYTVAAGNISGYWRDSTGRESYGEHREYRVALPDQRSALLLEEFAAQLAADLHEDCIFMENGEDAWLVYSDGDPSAVSGSQGEWTDPVPSTR
jgi:hypothetical protein